MDTREAAHVTEAKGRNEEELAVLGYLRANGPSTFLDIDVALRSPSDRVVKGRNRTLDNVLRRLASRSVLEFKGKTWKVVAGVSGGN